MHLFFITGTSKGLGKNLYEQLKFLGKDVISISKSFQDSKDQKIIHCDLASLEEVGMLKEKLSFYISSNIKKITVINNAGVIEPIEMIGDFTSSNEVVKHITINYLSPILLVDTILKIINKECEIEILNISTGAAEKPLASWSLYSSSKKAIKTFFDTLVLERENAKIIHIDPGVMDTNMQQEIRDNEFPLNETFVKFKEDNKLRKPNEVAGNIIKKYVENI